MLVATDLCPIPARVCSESRQRLLPAPTPQVCAPGTLTCIEAASGCRPAHDGRDGPNHGPHPRVGDAHPLQRCVTASVQENVEDAQGSRERVHSPRQEGHSWNRTTSREGHGQQRAGRQQRTEGITSTGLHPSCSLPHSETGAMPTLQSTPWYSQR